MKIRKFSAFTLAELLVIMAVLAVLMAAFAPVFTSRYTNMAAGSVWSAVPGDNNGHIYFDEPNKLLSQQAFLGITPEDSEIAKSEFQPYSKLIIRTSMRPEPTYPGDGLYQGQIAFSEDPYEANTSTRRRAVGSGYLSIHPFLNTDTDYNVILAGPFSTVSMYSTILLTFRRLAYARGLTVLGQHARGLFINNPFRDTVIDSSLGQNFTGGGTVENPFGERVSIGPGNLSTNDKRGVCIASVTSANGSDDSMGSTVGGDCGDSVSIGGAYKNLVAPFAYHNPYVYNEGIGTHNFINNKLIGYNASAVCYPYRVNALDRCGTPSHAIFISNYGDMPNVNGIDSLFRDTNANSARGRHIFIGNSTNFGPAALEVHANDDGAATVIVNGDLIVRGQSFFNTRLTYPGMGAASNRIVAHGLQTNDNTGFNPLVPWASHKDRQYKNRRLINDSRYMLPNFGAEETCQCTVGNNQSYDWTSSILEAERSEGVPSEPYSFGNLYRNYFMTNGNILNAAHNHDNPANSCCPNITSDARLKNIGEKFTPSYDELLKLAIYNYSYKTEGKKPTHVGVIAQDLKKIFPNAVSKDQNGYLKIRWDEMFYAMVNAVKDLNVKVQNLIAKVETNKAKINNLKVDNKKLEQKLDNLAQEIAKLEK